MSTYRSNTLYQRFLKAQQQPINGAHQRRVQTSMVDLVAAVWLQIASGNAYNFPQICSGFLSTAAHNARSRQRYCPCLIVCVATNSGAWLGTDVLVTNMRNFPVSRGTVAGILKGYAGLSAAVYTEIFGILLHNSSAMLLLFLTLGIPTLCIVMMYAVKPCTSASGEDSAERGHFLFIQVASMTLYPSNRSKLGTLGRPVGSSDQLIQAEGDMDKSEPLLTPSTSTTNIGSFHESDSVSEVDMLLAEGEGAVKKKRRPKEGKISLSVKLYSRSKTFPRTIWMTFTQIIMIITYLFFASALDGTLYITTAVLGICYGFQFSIMVPTAS
ncbi:unnamed protein product [Camellia sinensis]